MNPLMKIYLYENWCEDLVEKNEFAKNYGTFIGAFSNIEMARAITGEGTTNIETSTEEFEESLDMVRRRIEEEEKKKKQGSPQRHRRQVIV